MTTTKTKLSAKDKLLQHLSDNGWTEDSYARTTVGVSYHSGETAKDHHSFSIATEGGQFVLWLNYENHSSGYRATFDNRLRAAELWFVPENFERKDWVAGAYSRGPANRVSDSQLHHWNLHNTDLWNVTGSVREGTPIMDRVKKVVSHPEVVVWLAEERRWLRREQIRLDNIARREKQEASARPIANLTVPQAEFKARANKVYLVTEKLRNADGTSDVRDLLATLKTSVALLEEAVVPE